MLIFSRWLCHHAVATAVTVVVGAVGLAACQSVTEGEPAEVPAGRRVSNGPAAQPPLAPDLRVNGFLELSGSMKGFMPASTAARQPTAFQNRVGALASQTNRSPAIAGAKFLLTRRQASLGLKNPPGAVRIALEHNLAGSFNLSRQRYHDSLPPGETIPKTLFFLPLKHALYELSRKLHNASTGLA